MIVILILLNQQIIFAFLFCRRRLSRNLIVIYWWFVRIILSCARYSAYYQRTYLLLYHGVLFRQYLPHPLCFQTSSLIPTRGGGAGIKKICMAINSLVFYLLAGEATSVP